MWSVPWHGFQQQQYQEKTHQGTQEEGDKPGDSITQLIICLPISKYSQHYYMAWFVFLFFQTYSCPHESGPGSYHLCELWIRDWIGGKHSTLGYTSHCNNIYEFCLFQLLFSFKSWTSFSQLFSCISRIIQSLWKWSRILRSMRTL